MELTLVIADRLSQSVAPAQSNYVWEENNKLFFSQFLEVVTGTHAYG